MAQLKKKYYGYSKAVETSMTIHEPLKLKKRYPPPATMNLLLMKRQSE